MEITVTDCQNYNHKKAVPNFKSRIIKGLTTAAECTMKGAEKNGDYFIKEALILSGEVDKFLKLKGYRARDLLHIAEKKPGEINCLYDLASKKDKFGVLRIHSEDIIDYADLSVEEIQKYKPVLLSQNDLGTWNFDADIIKSLKSLDEKTLADLTKLIRYHVKADNAFDIISTPLVNMEKTVEKAESLNRLYGDNLREISFFSNSRGENYLEAHIQLPHREDKPDWQNFKRVFAKIDENADPVSRVNSKSETDTLVDNIYSELESKLCVFSENELNSAAANIKREFPKVSEPEILSVMQRLTQFANYSSLKETGKKLQEMNVELIYSEGGLNKCFDYFSTSKQILPLKPMKEAKCGYLVTRKDLENLDELSVIKEQAEYKDIVFINLEGWSDGVNLLTDDKQLESLTKTVITKAKKISGENPSLTFDEAVGEVLNRQIINKMKELGADITTIRLEAPPMKAQILEQMRPIMPTRGLIKSTIESISNHYTQDKKTFKDLCGRIAKYYDENINAFSKQRIIEDLKALNTRIKEYQLLHDIPDSNVRYLMPKIPCTRKSFELITTMFTDLFNVPAKNIKYVYDIESINKYPPNSAFVILDDIIASGESMLMTGEYLFKSRGISDSHHILFAPVTASQNGIDKIKNHIERTGRTGKDDVIYIPGNVKDYAQTKKIFTSADSSAFKYTEQVFGRDGHGKNGMCTVFPYMDPDNNSSLAGYLTKFFVPDFRCLKSKTTLVPVIEEKTYYYDIFGTDKEHILSDYRKVFSFRHENPLKRLIRNIFSS